MWFIKLLNIGSIIQSPFLKKYWRESLIVLLISGCAFMGWYYTSKNSRLEQDLLVTETALEQSKTNYKNIRLELDKNNEKLEELSERKKELDKKLSEKQNEIKKIQKEHDKKIQEIYSEELPKTCESKIDWIIDKSRSK